MRNTSSLNKYIPPGILAVSLLVVYLMTMAPGLTWANQGSDGGDLVTAAAVGGVAHPTGYPVYLFLARVFQLLPIGSLAFRTNLLSAFATIFAAILIYVLVIQSLPSTIGSKYAGLISAFAFGLSPLVWSQSVIAEVYSLHALFVIVILFLASDQAASYFPQKRLDVLIGFAFGLGMGNHITTILLFPTLIFQIFFHADSASSTTKWSLDTRSLFCRMLWAEIGLLAYLSLPLRALSQPKVNWGNPVTMDGFLWLVSGNLYQEQFFGLTFDLGVSRIRAAAGMLIEQFGIVGLVIGLIGLLVFFKPSRLFINTIWTVSIFTFFAIGYSTIDSYMYLIPVFSCFAIWIGFGVSGLMDMFHQRFQKFGAGISLVVILFLFLQAGNHWASVDASKDMRAEQFGNDVLLQAPANAIIFAKGDKAIFTMWYFHYALQRRPDLVVIATDLLHFDWYQKSLHTNYPELNLPGAYPFASTVAAANPQHPVCYVEYIQHSDISCKP